MLHWEVLMRELQPLWLSPVNLCLQAMFYLSGLLWQR